MSTTERLPSGALEAEVAPGVYRFGTARVNWYLVEADEGLTLIDAGLPGHWEQLVDGLGALDADLAVVDAVVLTHGHPDHIGFAERLRETAEVPVYVHEADRGLAMGADSGSMSGVLPNLWRPALLGLFYEMARSGGFSVPDVSAVETYADADVLDVPGEPTVIHVPGHSPGHAVVWLPDRETLFCGDALATYDLKTGRATEPRLLSLFNDDAALARESLDAIADLGRVTLLPGHGEPWTGDVGEAVRAVQRQ